MTDALAPLNWRSLGRPHKNCTTDMIRAVDVRSSDWTIYPEQKSGDRRLVKINFTAPIPEGEVKKDWVAKLMAREITFDDPQDYRDWQTISNKEIGSAITQDFAKQLVEMLRRGTGDLPDVRAILTEGGFRLYDEVCRERFPDLRLQCEHPNWYTMDMDKGSLSVTLEDAPEVGLTCRYDPKRSRFSHPLLFLRGDSYGHRGANLIPTVWPDGCEPLRIGARLIVDVLVPWVRENRMNLK